MRELLSLVFMAPILLMNACKTMEDSALPKVVAGAAAKADAAAPSGLVMVGSGPLYLVGEGGDVYEAELLKAGSDPLALYADDRRVTGERVYSLVTEPLSLADLRGKVKTFKAAMYRGPQGRGGAPLMSGVTVKLRRVVLRADGGGARARYFLFGSGGELFALRAAPGALRVDSVQVTAGVPSEAVAAKIRAGIYVDVVGELEEGGDADGQVQVGAERYGVTLHARDEVYRWSL